VQSILKPAVGAALALLLVLSAAPAQAFGPPPGDTDPATAVEEQGAGEETSSEDPAAVEDSEGLGEPAESDDIADPTDPESAEEVDIPADAVEAVGDAVADEEISEAPSEILVSGKLLFLPNEPAAALTTELHEHGEDSEAAHEIAEQLEGGTWSLATTEGPIVPVDTATLGGAVDSNSDFAGTLQLDAESQAEVQAEIDAEGSVDVAEVLDTVAEVSARNEAPAVVAGAAVAPEVIAGAPAKRQHVADIVVVGGATSQSTAQNLVTQSGSYWKGQTNSAVNGIKLGGYSTLPASAAHACNADSLWAKAAAKFGRTPASYYSGARHLVVYVAHGNCGPAGLGHVGSIHSGGTVWVDLNARASGRPVSDMLAVVAHEIGHNLSLGHGQVRECTGSRVDAKTSMQADPQTGLRVTKPVSPCRDLEYGDAWNIMGVSVGGVTPALSIAQKAALGVLPSGSVKTGTPAGGRTQTITISRAGNNSGLRGLKVNTQSGGSFYVEFRSGGGQDTGTGLGNNTYISFNDGRKTRLVTGVQVVKSYPKAQAKWTDGVWRSFDYKRSTVIPFRSGSTFYSSGKSGQSTTPVSSNARVTVVSTNATQAKVRISYTPFIDVPYDHKFGKEINWMSSKGLSTGINAGKGLKKYAPKSNVTREAMAAFLYRLNAPKGYKAPKTSPFSDVKPGQKFYKEISWMYKSGLSTGVKQKSGKPKFMPKSSVTREAMAAFIYRMEKATYKGAKTSQFSDVKRGQKFYKEISWMYQQKLSTGVKQKKGKPKYLPKSSVTREAMAAFIYRLES
jgi:hypothetical protein